MRHKNSYASSYEENEPWFLGSGWRLFGLILTGVFLPTVLFVSLIFLQARQILKQEATQQNAAAARLAAQAVQEHLEGMKRYVESFARRQTLSAWLEIRNEEQVRSHLKELVTRNNKFYRAFVANTHGGLWLDYPPVPAVAGKDFSSQDWYQGVSRDRKTYVSEVYHRATESHHYLVAVATPIVNQKREVVAYLVGQHTLESLSSWLDYIKPSITGSLLLIDHRGHLASKLYSEGQAPLNLHRSSVIQKMRATQEGSLEAYDPVTGAKSLLSYVTLRPTGWTVVSIQPIPVAYAILDKLRVPFLILSASYLVGLLGFQFLGLNAIRRYHRSRKQAEEARLEVQKALIEKIEKEKELSRAATENERLELMAFIASHDLQEPLHKIVALADLLEMQTVSLNEKARGYVDRMRRAALRMGELIQELLNFSKVTTKPETFESVPLKGLIQEILQDLEMRIKDSDARIEVEELPVVQGDRDQLRELFMNLIGNAVKFRKQNESPCVTIKSESADSGFTKIFVEDHGIGFDPLEVERLFRPFQRLHAQGPYEGSGLGLAICQKIVERHGGTITAEGRSGKGSIFCVALPLNQEFRADAKLVSLLSLPLKKVFY